MPGGAEYRDRVLSYIFFSFSRRYRETAWRVGRNTFLSRVLFRLFPSLSLHNSMHLRRSLGLVALTTATLASAATPLGVISAAGEGVVRFGLRNVLRLNESSIDMILNRGERPLDPHPYASECLPRSLRTSNPTHSLSFVQST